MQIRGRRCHVLPDGYGWQLEKLCQNSLLHRWLIIIVVVVAQIVVVSKSPPLRFRSRPEETFLFLSSSISPPSPAVVVVVVVALTREHKRRRRRQNLPPFRSSSSSSLVFARRAKRNRRRRRTRRGERPHFLSLLLLFSCELWCTRGADSSRKHKKCTLGCHSPFELFFSSWRAYTFRDGDVKRRRTHEYPSRRGARNDEREREST